MALTFRCSHLLYSPPSMEVLCTRRIRRMISDVGVDVQSSFVDKLTLGDFEYLDNHCKHAALINMSKYCY